MANDQPIVYNEAKFIKDLGDELFECGDLFSTYPLISVERAENYAKFEYQPYYITVYFTTSGNKRTFERWERVYKND